MDKFSPLKFYHVADPDNVSIHIGGRYDFFLGYTSYPSCTGLFLDSTNVYQNLLPYIGSPENLYVFLLQLIVDGCRIYLVPAHWLM